MERGDDDEGNCNGDRVGAGYRKRSEQSGQKTLNQACECRFTDPTKR
jgi:hypothetical protein